MLEIFKTSALSVLCFFLVGLIAEDGASSSFVTWYQIQKGTRMLSVRILRFRITGLPMERTLGCLIHCSVNISCHGASLDTSDYCVLGLAKYWPTVHSSEATTYLRLIGLQGCPKGFGNRFEPRKNGPGEQQPSCYRLNKKSLRWTAAGKACRENNGYLATIESLEEQKHVAGFIQECPGILKHYWLSLSFNPATGLWYWAATGKEMRYHNWFPGQPTFAAENAYCAVLSPLIGNK